MSPFPCQLMNWLQPQTLDLEVQSLSRASGQRAGCVLRASSGAVGEAAAAAAAGPRVLGSGPGQVEEQKTLQGPCSWRQEVTEERGACKVALGHPPWRQGKCLAPPSECLRETANCAH